jgi:hypothetical protein
MNCNHEFIGTNKGVHCNRCGLNMSSREYGEYCSAKEMARAGDNDAKQFVEDVENDEYCSEIIIQQSKDKPKRQPRKKVTKDE